MPSPPALVLRVARAPEGSALVRGAAFSVAGEAILGRSPDADVVLNDATVSRHHARLTAAPLAVEALTASNGTFVDGEALVPGAPAPLADGARLQLGGVILTVGVLAETDPVVEPLGARALVEPLLDVRWDAGQCAVRAGGRDLGLAGAAARLLGLLAGQAGQVVHLWDLQDELDTPHLAPLATAVRRALVAALRSGALDVRRVRAAVGAARVGDAVPDDPEGLGRLLVQSRRGHGYVLHLSAADVTVHRV
ncbi:MAG: FHA domain-containing protein [Myxococcota bacterium]